MTWFLYQTICAGKEQDNVETERESVRDRALLEMGDSVGNKIDC